jgi:1-acyl-sn-glycerol-3-phosphate acyltransferase
MLRSALRVVSNSVRIALCAAWTGVVGTALLLAVYPRYWYGLLRARAGRADVLDRVLEANAALCSWVAKDVWTTVLLALTGVRLRVREAVPIDWSRTYVVCANHASLFDIFALIRALPPPYRFVAKRELTRWPIFGWLLRPAGQVIVNRANHAEAVRSVAEAAVRRIRGQVVFFVEGTRTRTGELQPFKKGAFHFAIGNHLPVLPAAIRGSFAALARRPWWRLRPGHVIEVRFCPAIEPPGRAEGAVESLRDLTRDAIAAGIGA